MYGTCSPFMSFQEQVRVRVHIRVHVCTVCVHPYFIWCMLLTITSNKIYMRTVHSSLQSYCNACILCKFDTQSEKYRENMKWTLNVNYVIEDEKL